MMHAHDHRSADRGDFDAFARRIIDGGDDFDSAVITEPKPLFERVGEWLYSWWRK